ncbi:MAG: hypothetical protein R3C29_05435 [Dehalococcoidia bacterium]
MVVCVIGVDLEDAIEIPSLDGGEECTHDFLVAIMSRGHRPSLPTA